MGPGLPARGVDMFRNPRCASVGTELSNALAAWTYDPGETVSETRTGMLDFSAIHSCVPPCGCVSRHEGWPQRAPWIALFCHCPQAAALLENKSTERRVAGEGIFLMNHLPEF
jgi:hypothetical protein